MSEARRASSQQRTDHIADTRLKFVAFAGVSAALKQQQLPPVDVVYACVNATDPHFAQRFAEATNSSARCDRVESSNELLMGLTAICKHQR